MKLFRERLSLAEGASWAMLNRRLADGIPFQWHHHPEYELTLTLNSRGQRFIGDHTGRYDDGDLVLIGPNLAHTWSSIEPIDPSQPHVALVMWFTQDWADRLTEGFAELAGIAGLLRRATAGLHFSPAMARQARPQIEALFAQPNIERLLSLVSVLSLLAEDAAAQPLATIVPEHSAAGPERSRMDRVLDHLHHAYASPITLADLADVAALSQSGLHRTFLRHTGQTVSQYLTRLRIGQACALLTGTEQSVTQIAGAVGYGSLANFNRQFKALKAMPPRQYRTTFSRN
ncbi:transcriptional regulator [Devosia limi DSM 17137]|uniref:AraC-type DNA-binding protein n=1 Tax=Devosia limi DSM 17137 TaxID=1121477 RepID=A0A0F5LWM3_9HYPH|nr:AraC family transcriptional regulator [Devosia limi]KKB86775.1 transcriptional regulator [Devosia limi DSM 17137]SHF94930.1 AraC-type DNA-binding protein [Devosia limi DSM 17137]